MGTRPTCECARAVDRWVVIGQGLGGLYIRVVGWMGGDWAGTGWYVH